MCNKSSLTAVGHGVDASEDARFMALALEQARMAAVEREVPVGAVLVKAGVVLGVGRNSPISSNDPCAHAEVLALRSAAQKLGNYRLEGCTLYVTLEPCVMCSGAIFQARLDRVVFAAAEPKTGAAGSVLNLFQNATLNPQTQVCGGVLAQESADLLRNFFADRRSEQRQGFWPLRDDALRTPDKYFERLPDCCATEHFVNELTSLGGLRMHYSVAGDVSDGPVFFCVHGAYAWSYQFGPAMAEAKNSGCQIIAPDLIGFGKSDKPKRMAKQGADYGAEFQMRVLAELINYLDLQNCVLVVTGGAGAWALNLLPKLADRFQGLLVCSPNIDQQAEPMKMPEALPEQWFDAPYPDQGHRALFRGLGPSMSLDPSTVTFLRHIWDKPTILQSSDGSVVNGREALNYLLEDAGANTAGVGAKQSFKPAFVTADLGQLWSRHAG